MFTLVAVLVVLGALLLFTSINVLPEYQRAVVLTLGRYTGTKGPGVVLLIPVLQRMVRVDLRITVMDVPPQDVISRDNVSVRVNAVVYFRVVEPDKSVLQVVNFLQATSQLAQTRLRSVLGQHELDEILSQRESINRTLQGILQRLRLLRNLPHRAPRHRFPPILPDLSIHRARLQSSCPPASK